MQKKNGNSWQIKTVTGKTITGEMLSLVSKGFIVSRGSAAFLYSPGQDIKIISLPDGFHVAAFQNGEVMQTKYILIERDYTDEDKKNILNKVHSLGAALGVAKKEDYALFNFENNRIVFLNIDVSLKDVAYHKDCYKIGSGLINRCFSVQFQESLYRENGLPNGGHYYWRLGWFKSELGPLAIVKETTRVLIINLNENKMVKAFDRILGINWIVTRRNEKGKIEILAQLGFSKEIIDDVESFYFKNQHEAVRIES